MDSVGVHRPWLDARWVPIGWTALPGVIIGFLLLRYVADTRTALVVSQIWFLAPLVAAVVVLALASAQARTRSRARLTWGLFAAASACLLVGEASLSYRLLFAGSAQLGDGFFDVSNAAAIVLLFAGGGVAAALGRMGWRHALRLGLDSLALLTLAFGVLYRYIGEHHERFGGQGVGAGLRMTAYALIGVALFEVGLLVFGNAYALRAPWNRVLAAAMAMLAMAVTVWSVLAFGGGSPGRLAADIASSALYLTGYYLLLMAGLHRLSHYGRVWRSAPPIRMSAVWPELSHTLVAFGAVVWLAVRAADASSLGPSRIIYTAALSVATFCIVARTALASGESSDLTARTLTDPLTGAMGPRVFDRLWDAVVAEAERTEAQVAVYSVDMDGFALVNAAHGFRAGDRTLTAVARGLERALGHDAWVVRFGGDEFVVLAVVESKGAARQLGLRLCASVREAAVAYGATASVGVALRPDDAQGAEELVRLASSARIWAKRQGKNRLAAYDVSVGEAVSLDARLAVTPSVGRDMARALVAAADARDPASHDHARNVAALSRLLAIDLGIEPERVDRIEVAAVLHDVGKIALPDVMLGGRTLSAKEQLVAREHSLLGERLVESMSDPDISSWVRSHHERWDGAGFPDGLIGDATPLEARIIAIADAYDGMTAGRRYGAPMPKAAALQELDLGMGTRFDPQLAEQFIALVGTTGALGWSDQWTQP